MTRVHFLIRDSEGVAPAGLFLESLLMEQALTQGRYCPQRAFEGKCHWQQVGVILLLGLLSQSTTNWVAEAIGIYCFTVLGVGSLEITVPAGPVTAEVIADGLQAPPLAVGGLLASLLLFPYRAIPPMSGFIFT